MNKHGKEKYLQSTNFWVPAVSFRWCKHVHPKTKIMDVWHGWSLGLTRHSLGLWQREKFTQKRKNYPALRWFITCHHSDVHIHKLGECFSTKAKYPNNYQEIYIFCPQSGIHNWRPLATSIFSVGKHIPSLRTAYSTMIMSPILSNFLPWYEQKKY